MNTPPLRDMKESSMTEAERMAKALEAGDRSGFWYPGLEAAAELRRMSAVEAELEALKKAIGEPAPQSWPLPGWEVQQAKPQPLSEEQDRALCEAYCNTASDEYFSARPHLDSAENRRIFYAGHRKAWIEWQAAHGIKE